MLLNHGSFARNASITTIVFIGMLILLFAVSFKAFEKLADILEKLFKGKEKLVTTITFILMGAILVFLSLLVALPVGRFLEALFA